MKDLHSEVKVAQSLVPAARTDGTVNGTTVDRMGDADAPEFYQEALVVVTTGTITDGTHTITVQDSPDDLVWTPVADGFLQGAEPAIVAANDNAIFEIGYLGLQRYVRVSVTTAGAATGGVFSAAVVLGGGRNRPPVRS